jgi:hypothetical protein
MFTPHNCELDLSTCKNAVIPVKKLELDLVRALHRDPRMHQQLNCLVCNYTNLLAKLRTSVNHDKTEHACLSSSLVHAAHCPEHTGGVSVGRSSVFSRVKLPGPIGHFSWEQTSFRSTCTGIPWKETVTTTNAVVISWSAPTCLIRQRKRICSCEKSFYNVYFTMEVPLAPKWYKTSAHLQTELHVCSQALFSLKQNCSSTRPQDSSLICRCSWHNIAIRQNTVTSCRNWWSVNHCLVSPITVHTCIALAAIQNLQESTKKRKLNLWKDSKHPEGWGNHQNPHLNPPPNPPKVAGTLTGNCRHNKCNILATDCRIGFDCYILHLDIIFCRLICNT